MNTKSLSTSALQVIDAYLHFRVGGAVANIPYFNNKTARARISLRAFIGKGTPRDIREEVEAILVKNQLSAGNLADESLKKILVDHNLGIDCSALAYYVLDAESKAQGQGHLNRRLHFVNTKGPMRKLRSYLRPAENCSVKTLASDSNSHVVGIKNVKPGDFISMQGTIENAQRDHILIITDVAYENEAAKSFGYVHAVAYPEDGLYGTGIRQGRIDISYPDQPLTSQLWTEDASAEKAGRIFERASASRTEIRRLKWLS